LNIVANFTEDEAMANVDSTRVRQIIDNLMENAVRILPADGTIKFGVSQTVSKVEIVVEDDGPGLTDSDVEVAFEPAALYSRYAGLREVGTGLGLALVGRLAERMGGKAFAAHSDLGGARFSVEFPKV
jgi:two-component system sensor histidine kinase BaeS